MLPGRFTLAGLIVLSWCCCAWHEGLEAAGWLPEHTHHHHTASTTGEHPEEHHHAEVGDEHDPVWARERSDDSRQALDAALSGHPPEPGDFHSPARETDAALSSEIWRPPPSQDSGPGWLFARRCAPEATAPPVEV